MATAATGPPVVEEGKLLSESLSTVKIQVQQMRRYLVRLLLSATLGVQPMLGLCTGT